MTRGTIADDDIAASFQQAAVDCLIDRTGGDSGEIERNRVGRGGRRRGQRGGTVGARALAGDYGLRVQSRRRYGCAPTMPR